MQPEKIIDRAKAFEASRQKLTGIAYRMTGSHTDAEDVLQDTWLRWQTADLANLENPEAYLVTIASRLCLDRLRRRQREKVTYIGHWLPEPLLTEGVNAPAIEHETDISYALLVALERLSPSERAAFILHDVFEIEFREIAQSLGKSEAACRQLAKRARDNLRTERPRFAVAAEDHEAVAAAFFKASRENDVEEIMRYLADGADLHSDGGGRKIAALNIIKGASHVARFFAGLARKPGAAPPIWRQAARLNGLISELTLEADGTRQATAVEVASGRITTIYLLRNPDKLGRLWAAVHDSDRNAADPSTALSPDRRRGPAT
ncbi:MAG: RNA polymerase sigma factor SigJ [Roseovarius sp.]|uniref:RNA polymerase sigma factor SigJ n=1 Tax=Roseovarius sp. TaxID=1486281 RepID=UPI001B5B218E|nr:RNA polymerase sigma factor SigJ [Roseovarius sp.]MBQ0751439.1 RNA polymerase sigma factor SigJ [Roseovarius sp.]MBQ0809544.1 RNA polymerase sigma factor SigJ [Roseovarius sp.]